MGEEEKSFKVTVNRVEGFRFDADFGLEGVPSLRMDEPPPLGDGRAPNASRVLAAAMGDCMAASLLFCLQRARADVGGVKAVVDCKMTRNERGRWRITEVAVELLPEVPPGGASQLRRCSEIFEDFCVVSKSVEAGIPLRVTVKG